MNRTSLWSGLLVLWAVTGCSTESTSSSPPGKATVEKPASREKLSDVTLALNWFPEMEHGGFYAALVHGYYADAGLNVDIRPGGPNAPVAPMVAGGQVQFGIENADRILMFREQDADIVGLLAPLQTSPRCLVLHAGSPIKNFDELEDITLAMSSAAPWAIFLQKKLPLTGVKIVPNPGNLALFLNDKKFVQQGYVFSEPVLIASKGEETRSLLVSDLGFNPYTSVLITQGETVRKNPELVRKMVEASLKGWKKYLEDPTATHEKIHSLNPEMPLDVLAKGFEAMKPLCLGDDPSLDKVGRMTSGRWKELADQLVEVGILKTDGVQPDAAFNTKFIAPADASPN